MTGRFVVIAPPEVVAGFALAGARTLIAASGGEAVERVAEAVADQAVVVAVHDALWGEVPGIVRQRWEQPSDHLVFALPPDDGAPMEERDAELHELLARAVGYEISFTTGGSA